MLKDYLVLVYHVNNYSFSFHLIVIVGYLEEEPMCLAGAVANVADSNRCCNPKVPSSIPAGGKDFPWARKFNHIAQCRGGTHKSTGPLCVYSELKYGK